MKKISKYYTLLAILIMAGAVFAGISLKSQISGLFSDSEHSEKREYLRQADLGEGKGSGEDEDASERTSWFLKQRLFGLGEIPEKARERAKKQADKIAAPLGDGLLAPTVGTIWNPVGPQPLDSLFSTAAYGDASGRINWIAVHPTNNNIVLLGTATGGIWRSINALAADGQVVFTPVTDNQVDLAVGSIAFAPSNPNIVYSAMGDRDNDYYGTGILKSIDAGATWTKINTTGLPDKGFSLSITVRSDNPNTIYVVRGEPSGNALRNVPPLAFDMGVYRSTNGGLNWTKTLDGKVTGLAERPSDPDFLYASVLSSTAPGAAAPGFYRSTDSGATFRLLGGSPDISAAEDYRVAISQANSDRIYFYGGVGGDANKTPPVQGNLKLIVLTDDILSPPRFRTNNLTFSQIDPTQFHYNTYLVADPFVDGRLYLGSRDVYRLTVNTNDTVTNSENLTVSFTYNNGTSKYDNTERGSKAHADQQFLAFAGTNSAQFFLAHDGGVSRTLDTGANFTKNLNRTLSLDQAIGLSVKPSDSDKIYVGAQDNGTQRRLTGTNWKEFNGGDGGRNRLIAPDFTRLYVNSTKGSFERFDNVETAVGGGNVESVDLADPSVGHRISFYPPAESNGTDATLYVGTETLAVCTTCGTTTGTWTYPANGNGQDLTKGTSDHINAMAVQKLADGGVPAIYTGSEQGAFWVRQTGSQTFTDRSAILKAAVGGDRFITSVKMDLNDPSIAYITVSGFGTANHVLKSTAYGVTITRLNFSVDIPVNDFVIDPATPTTFYIGTDIGIFRSLDSGANWITFNVGLPPVIVMRLASTNGRGTFTSRPQSLDETNPLETPNQIEALAVVTNSITAATYGRGVYQNIIAGTTAAAVSVSGRVLTTTGRGISGARVSLTDSDGQVRLTSSSSFGYYQFDNVQVGRTYVLSASGKHYTFSQPMQVLNISEQTDGINFIANSEKRLIIY